MIAPPAPRLTGLIGYPVEHSLSPAMHNAALRALGLDWRYDLRPTAPERLESVIRECVEEGYAGWNITVPHKERVVSFLDEASREVSATGACNTVRVENGRLAGYNTDIAGFLAGLSEAGGVAPDSGAVVLGAGGAARAVSLALASAGYSVLVLARNPAQAASLVHSLQASTGHNMEHGSLNAATLGKALEGSTLLVNCTPAGMWPHAASTPIPAGVSLPSHLLVYDLVYRPRPTLLLQHAEESGCRTQDGLAMLVHQGAAAFEIWTGLVAPVEVMKEACLDGLRARDTGKQES